MEYSVLSKDYGILTKEMRLENDEINKDGSQCRMANGSVQTVSASNLIDFAENLSKLNQNQAIATGTADGAHEKALRIVKKGLEAVGEISRTKDFFKFKAQPTPILLDYDPEKGKPALSIDKVHTILFEIMPELVSCEILALGSTSCGVYREGETAPETSIGGIHFYIAVDDGTKIPELGKLIAQRCWLRGYARFDISKSGALLSRTLFDETVHSPERLIFEAEPVLGAGLKQLPRLSLYRPGGVLKTAEIRGLTAAEEESVNAAMAKAKTEKQPEAEVIKAAHSKAEVARLVSSGVSKSAALEQVEKSNNGVLTGSHPLQFSGLPVVTVTDVLRNPSKFHEWGCLDPDETLEGGDNFRAKFYRNEKNMKINSFRHGGGSFTIEKTESWLDQDNPFNTFDQTEAVLNIGRLPDVFTWGGVLSYIGRDGAVRSLTATSAPVIIGRLIRFYTLKKVQEEWIRVRAEMPDKLWRAFLEKGSWNVPELKGIVHAPYFFNGEVVESEGYHAESGLYLTTGFEFLGIKNATPEAAKAALSHIRGTLSGFPPEAATDEAVMVAMMLTAMQRPTLETSPMFAISANTPGTGKTQLATGIASLMTGEVPAVHGFRDNEQEFAKMLMSALLQGDSTLIIDNVKLGVALGGDALCAVLSSPVYVDRELGYSRTRRVSTRALMVATGNNLKLASDVTRRTVMIKLDARCERPELREFEKNFVQICREEREAILKSVLTILSAYHAAGRPKVGNIRLGTFEQWTDEICAPLVWLGMVDPALGLAKPDADEGVAGLGELLAIWRHEIHYQRVTTAEVLHHAGVSEFFRQEFEDKGGVNVRKVGRLLAKYAGRIVDGMRITQDGNIHRAVVWRFEEVNVSL